MQHVDCLNYPLIAEHVQSYIFLCRGVDVDVKRLPKRPAPPRFGRKLTEAQKVRLAFL